MVAKLCDSPPPVKTISRNLLYLLYQVYALFLVINHYDVCPIKIMHEIRTERETRETFSIEGP